MLALVLCAQLAIAAQSVYSTPSVKTLVDRAVTENRAPPPDFGGYRARVESELSLILHDTLGRENAAQIEQLASSVHWIRGGDYEMHVIGYRSQGTGVPYSTLSFVRGWTEPSLYGQRLILGAQIGSARDSARARQRTDTTIAVHPFAIDRERFYRYSGGDTVAVLHTGSRLITIVRIHVTPTLRDSTRFAAFDGDIQLDSERGHIVRMRGKFVVAGPTPKRRPLISRLPGIVAVAYSDFVNAEVNGKYWLPATQRTEFQSTIAFFGASRAVMRIVSQFADYEVDDARTGMADKARIAHVTSWAPSDSISKFEDWRESVGVATTNVNARDFDDIGPDIWRTTGRPLVDFFPTKTENMIGYDRVGGFYTGVEGHLRLRDAFPGLSAGARVGWAWTEQTVRGGANVSLQRGASTYGVLAERTLMSTNDFRRVLEPESGGIAAFISSIDSYDYVDRKRALVSLTQTIPSFDDTYLTIRLGPGRDNAEVARLTHGLRSNTIFRPNRGSASGSYLLGAVDLNIHPSVTGDFVDPGVGVSTHYEIGSGTLDWQRAEMAISMRQYVGPVTLALHAHGGAVYGSAIPPQQLFELGGSGTLPGYDFKEFVGDRAALLRSYASYTFPIWRAPRRVFRNIFLPGLAPGVALGFSGGWTEISGSSTSASIMQLGAPIRATDGVRGTAGAGVTFFGGNVHLGLARAVDHVAPWKVVFGVGTEF